MENVDSDNNKLCMLFSGSPVCKEKANGFGNAYDSQNHCLHFYDKYGVMAHGANVNVKWHEVYQVIEILQKKSVEFLIREILS